MKVLTFLVARWRRRLCSSRQRSRTLHGRDGEKVTLGSTCPSPSALTIHEHRQWPRVWERGYAARETCLVVAVWPWACGVASRSLGASLCTVWLLT